MPRCRPRIVTLSKAIVLRGDTQHGHLMGSELVKFR